MLPTDPLDRFFNPDDLLAEPVEGGSIPLAEGPFEEPGADESASTSPISTRPGDDSLDDVRIYFKYAEGWSAHIKRDWMKEYCYSQNPGEDFYHVLVGGEVYVQRGTEKFCITCALRHGYVTRDRMHWQRGGARPSE
jgi:hypothetical protein